MTENEFMT